MTKCHVQQINYLSAWTQNAVEVCQSIASSFMMMRKSQITLQRRLEVPKEDLLLAWQTSTHSAFHLSSLAKLAKEFLYTRYSKLLQTLFGQKVYLEWLQNEVAPTDVYTEHLPISLSLPKRPSHLENWQGRVDPRTLSCVMSNPPLFSPSVPQAPIPFPCMGRAGFTP